MNLTSRRLFLPHSSWCVVVNGLCNGATILGWPLVQRVMQRSNTHLAKRDENLLVALGVYGESRLSDFEDDFEVSHRIF